MLQNCYEKLKKSIVVLIVDFKLKKLKSIPKYITKWNLREDEYAHIVLIDVLEIYIIALEKFTKQAELKANKNLNFWIEFIKNPEVMKMNENIKNVEDQSKELSKKTKKNSEDKSLKETMEAIKKAQEKLKQIIDDEHEIYLAELREKYIRDQYSIEAYGYDRGKKDGEVYGKKIKSIEIAKKMLEQKIDSYYSRL